MTLEVDIILGQAKNEVKGLDELQAEFDAERKSRKARSPKKAGRASKDTTFRVTAVDVGKQAVETNLMKIRKMEEILDKFSALFEAKHGETSASETNSMDKC